MEHQWTTTMVLPVPRWYRTVRQQLFSTGSTTNNRNNVLVLAMGTIVHVAMLVRTTRCNKEEQATTSNNKQHQATTTTTSTTTTTTTTTTTSSIVNGGFTRCGHSFVVVVRPFIFVRVVWPCKIPFAEKENNERKKERALIRQCGGGVVTMVVQSNRGAPTTKWVWVILKSQSGCLVVWVRMLVG